MSRPAEPAIVFDRVWKKFRRGEIHDSLRDLIPALSRRFLPGRKGAPRKGDFWAVRNLSFTVDAGEVLGIIGGNGAGKSTTLKILTRILRPTAGRASVRGRMGALIEISAGFHQDLTGRENVFLQGSIMGMPVAQIRRKFDQIVAFSGIEDFIDTPVKRYSSGMQMRLAFAVAAHLDPDILLLDEVLAVGDLSFQQKCLERVEGLVNEVKTFWPSQLDVAELEAADGTDDLYKRLMAEAVAHYEAREAEVGEDVMRKLFKPRATVDFNGGRLNARGPFGGYKKSGIGREIGPLAIEEFFQLKSIQR